MRRTALIFALLTLIAINVTTMAISVSALSRWESDQPICRSAVVVTGGRISSARIAVDGTFQPFDETAPGETLACRAPAS